MTTPVSEQFAVHRTTLANGLTTLVAPTAHGHVMHAALFLHVGSRFETRETNGASHFVEHLLFQGNSCFADSAALCAFVEERGGEVNAQTTPDFTQVYLTVHRDYAEEGLRALAALVFGAAVDRWDVERERQIILHEQHGGNGDSDAEIRRCLWPDHPMGYEVSGTPANVRRLSADDLAAHYRTYYRPANAVLAVAGCFDGPVVDALVQEVFGAVGEPGQPVPSEPDREVEEAKPRRLVLDAMGGGCGVLVAMPACGLRSPDVAPLQAANFLLGGGLSSRLFLRVRERDGLAYDIGTGLSHFQDRGYFLAHAACRREQVLECTTRLLEEIRQFGEQGVTDEEMTRMQRFMHCQMDYRADDPAELAAWYGVVELLERPEKLLTPQDEAQQIGNLTREEVNDVLRRWIRPDAASVLCHTDGGWWHRRRLRHAIDVGMNWSRG